MMEYLCIIFRIIGKTKIENMHSCEIDRPDTCVQGIKRGGKRLCLLVLVFGLLFIATSQAKDVYAKSDKIVLQLRWNHQFQFAGYYAANWMGYFKENGLDVEIRPAFTKDNRILDATKEVESGRADFGIGAVDILIAENNGAGFSVVYSLFQRSAVEFYMRSDTKFNSIMDLVKLNTARREHDLLDIEYQAMLISEGIKPNNSKLIPYNYDFSPKDLGAKKFDVIPGYLGTIEFLAKKQGVSIKRIRPIDYGIDFYGDSLFVKRELAEKNPQLVERFKEACLKGWQYALEHPVEIAARISKEFKVPGMSEKESYEHNNFQSKKVIELTYYPVVQIGNINPYRWVKMQEVLLKLGLVSGHPDFNKFIFNYSKIMEEQNRERQKIVLQLILASSLAMLIFFLVRLASKNSMLRKENEERRKAEEKIRRSTQRYETMFSSADLGITITSATGEILQANRKWLEMTGYEEVDVIGKNIGLFVAPGEEKVQELREKYMNGEIDSYKVEQRFLRKDGRPFWGRLYLTSIFDQDSDDKVNMGMVLDINNEKIEEETVRRSEKRFRRIINYIASEITTTEEIDDEGNMQSQQFEINEQLSEKEQLSLKLEKINLELERMFKNEMDENRKKEALLIYQARLAAMGEMIANIAHQWRQPLNMLGLIISNIKDAYEYNELEKGLLDESVKKSRKLIGRMSDTIDDFRFFLNPKAEKTCFSVEQNIRIVLELLEENLRFNKIQVNLMSETDEPGFGYANQFSQAIFNIISNSIDAIIENHIVNGRLDIGIYKSGESIISEIRDNGGGIIPEAADKIFDIYFTTKNEGKGTGLGLYMTKLIIENNLKGNVELVNNAGGVTMQVSIPASR